MSSKSLESPATVMCDHRQPDSDPPPNPALVQGRHLPHLRESQTGHGETLQKLVDIAARTVVLALALAPFC